ncbi:KGK domain-containing protein [Rivularia sp. PCC 7116]|uniref:KGK domain-containing protein n=1 Tax=Rivularia sp. PCC 7116 TaxID=373994 RepID=UPI0002E61E3B|nr:KGK domain-containing protein [Rivularia sp. PCC 7116]
MESQFKSLSCNDDDVLSYNGSLVKFSQFKQQLENELWQKVNYLLTKENDGFTSKERIYELVNTSFGYCNISVTLSSPEEGNDCEILRLGATSWQKGKIRTKSSIDFFPNEKDSSKIAKIQINLEFLPEKHEVQQPQFSFDGMMYAA